MANKINPLVLSYPNFVLGQIIDPDEANQNNSDITNKVNEFIVNVEEANTLSENAETKADDAISISQGAETIANTKGDEAIIIANDANTTANNAVTKADTAIGTANTALDNSNLAIDTSNTAETTANNTKDELDMAMANLNDAINRAEQAVIEAESAVGNTEIRYDVFVITNSDNGDGTFTYKDNQDNIYTGTLTSEGYQRFQLSDQYFVGYNRIEATINDSLTRSQASGGLKEVGTEGEGSNLVDLTYPMGSNTEVTFKYYMQVSLSGKHGMTHNPYGSDALITITSTEPTEWYAGQMLFREV